jgi:hypothetical protein
MHMNFCPTTTATTTTYLSYSHSYYLFCYVFRKSKFEVCVGRPDVITQVSHSSSRFWRQVAGQCPKYNITDRRVLCRACTPSPDSRFLWQSLFGAHYAEEHGEANVIFMHRSSPLLPTTTCDSLSHQFIRHFLKGCYFYYWKRELHSTRC